MALTKEQAIEAWTGYHRRISVGAYEERSSYHYETDTWPEDGVEESVANLESWAEKQGLEFVWDLGTRTWSLMAIEQGAGDE